jgi:cytochrome P450
MTKSLPGPSDRRFGLSFVDLIRRDPLAFAMRMARDHGDFSLLRIAWVHIYFVSRPALIREILVTRVGKFQKATRQMRALRKVEGDGLVVSENPIWERHRPVVQGSFHHRHFENYAQIVVESTRRRLDQWPQNESFDVAADANEMALDIMARVVFGVDLTEQAAELRDAVHAFRVEMMREVSNYFVLPDWLPLPGKIRQKRAIRKIDNLIWSLIRDRQQNGSDQLDMLSQILAAVTNRPDLGVTVPEVRDETATLFIAGHDSTSASLAWFWYAVTSNSQVQDRIIDEVDRLGGKIVEFADIARLKYLEMAVKESMRLYPATGLLYSREPKEDIELGGHRLKRGSWIFIAPIVVQRDPAYFPDPEKFDPERFAPGRENDIVPYSFLNFGAGPRVCVGRNLATMEITLVAATILQRFRMVLDQGKPEPELEVFLRPKGGLRMTAIPRLTASRSMADQRPADAAYSPVSPK